VAFCFKVLAHLEDPAAALAEMARVVRPGGWVLAELYNPWSLRRLVKRMKRPTPISERTDDAAVLTRYDDAAAIRRMLPPELSWRTSRGIRIVTPVAAVHRLPGLGAAVRAVERALADLPGARSLGGFLVVCAQRR
jgi:SAM-dependent methyltransferase